jgi:hypothetical protein
MKAGPIRILDLGEAAAAPVLVTGRVLSVSQGRTLPEGAVPWKAQTMAVTAEIEVLRSRRSNGEPIASSRIRVGFMAYGPSVTAMVNGTPLPNLRPGDVLVLPLKENPVPELDSWTLIADSGMGVVIPSLADLASAGTPLASGRAFIDFEIANTLSRGTPTQVFAVSSYLSQQYGDFVGELVPLLETAIGDDRTRWAEVATSLLAAQGIPQPSVAELMTGAAQTKDWLPRRSLFLAQVALQKLKASAETDELLIATAIADMPAHDWGSANLLLEYGEHPATTEGVRQALRNDVSGACFVAFLLVRNGHRAVLPDALVRALKAVDDSKADTDLQGAAGLLRDYGSDQDLRQLAALVQKFQTQDEKYYMRLWQSATEAGNPREARVLAVVLRDRRVVYGDLRYCDLAVGVLGRAVGQDFSAGASAGAPAALPERNAAVARALAWIAAQGFPG